MDSGTSLLAGPSGIVAQINEAIGASGLASQECKSVVSQYGDLIMELLMVQTSPEEVCSKIGLHYFDDVQGNNGFLWMCSNNQLLERSLMLFKLVVTGMQRLLWDCQ